MNLATKCQVGLQPRCLAWARRRGGSGVAARPAAAVFEVQTLRGPVRFGPGGHNLPLVAYALNKTDAFCQ